MCSKEAQRMSGVGKPIIWKESAEDLYWSYKVQEEDVQARKRLLALWLLRRGESVSSAAKTAGVGRRTLTCWIGWYREGGLEEVLKRVPGRRALGNEYRLFQQQQRESVECTSQGEFRREFRTYSRLGGLSTATTKSSEQPRYSGRNIEGLS